MPRPHQRPLLPLLVLATALTVGMLAPGVNAQRLDAADAARARMLGKLQHTMLDVHIEDAPARDVLTGLGRAIDVPLVVRYLDDRFAGGIDPETPITLFFRNTDARTVLESVVEQCAVFDPCTWQLRTGFVEVGTKPRLSAASAHETRVIPIRDLMIAPPYFVAPSLIEPPKLGRVGGGSFGISVQSGGLGNLGNLSPQRSPDAMAELTPRKYAGAQIDPPAELRRGRVKDELVVRKYPAELAREIVRLIVEVVEPDNWDVELEDVGNRADGAGRRSIAAPRHRRFDGSRPPGRIRLFDDRLVVTAPDFMLRQIDGDPALITPRRLGPEELEERTAEASGEAWTIAVVGIASRRGGAATGSTGNPGRARRADPVEDHRRLPMPGDRR